MKDLDRQIQAAKEKIIKRAIEIQKAVALTTYNYITTPNDTPGDYRSRSYGSPRLTGRFVASHTIAINRIDTTVQPENLAGVENPLAPPNKSIAASTLHGLHLGDIIYIANSLDYAKELEYDSPSMKAPTGVYIIASLKVSSEFKNVKVIKNGGI